MLRLPRWLSYRDRVLEHLDTLLVMYPRGRQFTADFPGLRHLIRAHFDDGAPPAGAALALAARIMAGLLRGLDPADRKAVAARLRTLDLREMEPLVARQISRRPDPPVPEAEFAVRLVGGALLMARRLAEEGTLHPREHAFMLEALDDALPPAADGQHSGSLAELFGLPDKPSLWRNAP